MSKEKKKSGSAWEMDDADLLNFLDEQATKGLTWIARESDTGRGYRLHQHDGLGSENVRDAIRVAAFTKSQRSRKVREQLD